MLMDKSTHKVEVVSIELKPHPNADALSVVQVFGYTVVTRTEGWQNITLGAYLPPDSLVDTSRPEFAFLATEGRTHERIKARKLRGIQSYGLLIPAPAGSKLGDNVAELLGVEHWEPTENLSTGGEAERPPTIASGLSKYDIDSMRRYQHIFQPDEMAMVTEKIHGANSSYVYSEGRMWCRSHTEWKREDANNLWWKALANTPQLEAFCRIYPDIIVYGEVYGSVQKFQYGCKKGEVRFMAFDVYGKNGFINALDARQMLEAHNVPQVPLLSVSPFDFEKLCTFAEGQSTVAGADHIREGCVVKPLVERWNEEVGRVILKIVGAGYLNKS
jgi:RNA ligase (TIGR02306 family)